MPCWLIPERERSMLLDRKSVQDQRKPKRLLTGTLPSYSGQHAIANIGMGRRRVDVESYGWVRQEVDSSVGKQSPI